MVKSLLIEIRTLKKNTLYLLRHGKLKQQKVLAGHTDFTLSDEGQQQLINATLSLPKINQIYSSSLSRCALFAMQLATEQKVPLLITDSLKEMNFGDWDGKTFESLWLEKNKQDTNNGDNINIHIGDFWENPWKNPPPNGETMVQFTQRIDDWWQTFLCEEKKDNSLLISHAGVIKHLLARIAGLNITKAESLQVFDVPYASLIRIDITHDEEQQKSWPKIVF